MSEKNVIKDFEDYFKDQQDRLKEEGYTKVEEVIKDNKNYRNQIEFLQNKLYIAENKKFIRKVKGIKNKEKLELMREFNLKDVGGGVYGEGFFDGLRTAKRHFKNE